MRGLPQVAAEGPYCNNYLQIKGLPIIMVSGHRSKVKAQVVYYKSRSVLQLKCCVFKSSDIITLYLWKSTLVHRIVWIGSLVEQLKFSSYSLESIALSLNLLDSSILH